MKGYTGKAIILALKYSWPVSSLVNRDNELLYLLACPNPSLQSLRQNSRPTLSSAKNLKPIIFEMTLKCTKFNFLCLKVKLNCINNGIWSIIKLKCYWLCIQIKKWLAMENYCWIAVRVNLASCCKSLYPKCAQSHRVMLALIITLYGEISQLYS